MPTIRSNNMSETATLATKQNPLQYVTEQLNELRTKGVASKLHILEGEQRPVCVFDGREVINLASNNYLGLTTHKALRKAALDAVKRYGAGAGAVRTIAGTMKIHMELEEQIAAFKNVEACVVFQSGFTANAGTVSAVLGKDDLIDFLYLRARPFLFSTSHPPATAAACQAAFALLDSPEGEKLVKKLWANTKMFKRELKKRGFQFKVSETPIIPIHVGDAAKAFEFSKKLFEAGVFAPAVGYPTVAEGKARLRAMVSATHKRDQLLRAADILAEVAKPLGIVS